MVILLLQPAQIMQFLSTVPEQSIIVAHLGVNGALNASGTLQGDYGIDDLTPSKFKLIALGHFHRPQLFTKNMFYVGATVQQSFSDEIPSNELNGFYIQSIFHLRYLFPFVVLAPHSRGNRLQSKIPFSKPDYRYDYSILSYYRNFLQCFRVLHHSLQQHICL